MHRQIRSREPPAYSPGAPVCTRPVLGRSIRGGAVLTEYDSMVGTE
jgi:hypothetical protein